MDAKVILPYILGAVSLVGFGGGVVLYAKDNFAKAEDVAVVKTQAAYSLDLHMQSIMAQIARLEAKHPRTPEDEAQLKYLRDELERMRKMRAAQ